VNGIKDLDFRHSQQSLRIG